MNNKIVLSRLICSSLVFCLLASILFIGCSEVKPTTIGGVLKVADIMEAISPGYPPKLLGTQTKRKSSPAVETLLRTAKSGEMVPWLATNYKTDATAMTITLSLRKGVKFHDGTDFNAEAVKWNLDQCKAAKTTGTGKFKSIDVVDDYTVRINLTDWDSTILNNFAQSIGFMISPAAYKKNGEEWCMSNLVGTGPFQFVSWNKDVSAKYKKFVGYWQQGKPYLDGVEYLVITDPLTEELAFRSKELDLGIGQGGKGTAALAKDGFILSTQPMGSGCINLVPDAANPNSPFSKLKVRQATQYAIDNVAIINSIYAGQGEPTNQWTYKGHWAYNPNVAGYPYNPTKAKQLLTEAGYANGFNTTLTFRTSSETNENMTAVQGYLKAVGINATMQPVDSAKYMQLRFGAKWEGLLYGPAGGDPDVVASLVLMCTGVNYYSQMLLPDDYLTAIKNAISAPDFENKKKYAQEVMKLIVDKYAIMIMIGVTKDVAYSQTYLHNHGFMGTQNTSLWTPEDVWLDKK